MLTVPARVAPNGAPPRVWVDGEPVRTNLRVAEGSAGILATGDELGESRSVTRAPLARWPVVWRAYDAFDLVVPPAGWDRILVPEQQRALSQWVKSGGAVATVSRDLERSRSTPLGDGVAIAARTLSEAEEAHARWQRSRSHGGIRLLLDRWGSETQVSRAPTPRLRAAAGMMAAVGAYLALLGVLPLVCIGRKLRPARMPAVCALVVGGCLAVWTTATWGSAPMLEVGEFGLLVSSAGAGDDYVSSVVRLEAQRSGTAQFVSPVTSALLHEVEASRSAPDPHRAVRWDVERRAWERAWAMGEQAVLRLEGVVPDLGIRASRANQRGTWEIENGGSRALRQVLFVPPVGQPRRLPDLLPGDRVVISGGATANAGTTAADAALAFWSSLVPASGTGDGMGLVVAMLDPPLQSLAFPEETAAWTGQTRVALVLPDGAGAR
jgi:hypothetical protein